MVNPLIVAIQGLGFGAAQVALQGLLQYVVNEVAKAEFLGGNRTRRRTTRRATPNWLPVRPVDDEDALLLLGII